MTLRGRFSRSWHARHILVAPAMLVTPRIHWHPARVSRQPTPTHAASRRFLPLQSDDDVEGALGAISNDLWYHVTTWMMANELAGAADASPVFLYRLTVEGYTGHGGDTPLWSGVLPKCDLEIDAAKRAGCECHAARTYPYIAYIAGGLGAPTAAIEWRLPCFAVASPADTTSNPTATPPVHPIHPKSTLSALFTLSTLSTLPPLSTWWQPTGAARGVLARDDELPRFLCAIGGAARAVAAAVGHAQAEHGSVHGAGRGKPAGDAPAGGALPREV